MATSNQVYREGGMMFPLRTFRLALLALLAVALTLPVTPLGSLAQDATRSRSAWRRRRKRTPRSSPCTGRNRSGGRRAPSTRSSPRTRCITGVSRAIHMVSPRSPSGGRCSTPPSPIWSSSSAPSWPRVIWRPASGPRLAPTVANGRASPRPTRRCPGAASTCSGSSAGSSPNPGAKPITWDCARNSARPMSRRGWPPQPPRRRP